MDVFCLLENLFSELLTSDPSSYTETEKEEIQEFVAAGEFGLALRTAVAIFVEEKKTPSFTEKAILNKVADLMTEETRAYVRKLDA